MKIPKNINFWEKGFVFGEIRESNQSIQYVRQTGIEKVAYPEMILKLARTQDGFITKQDVADLLKITPDQAYSKIKKLVADGKLYKYCGGKYTKYKVKG